MYRYSAHGLKSGCAAACEQETRTIQCGDCRACRSGPSGAAGQVRRQRRGHLLQCSHEQPPDGTVLPPLPCLQGTAGAPHRAHGAVRPSLLPHDQARPHHCRPGRSTGHPTRAPLRSRRLPLPRPSEPVMTPVAFFLVHI